MNKSIRQCIALSLSAKKKKISYFTHTLHTITFMTLFTNIHFYLFGMSYSTVNSVHLMVMCMVSVFFIIIRIYFERDKKYKMLTMKSASVQFPNVNIKCNYRKICFVNLLLQFNCIGLTNYFLLLVCFLFCLSQRHDLRLLSSSGVRINCNNYERWLYFIWFVGLLFQVVDSISIVSNKISVIRTLNCTHTHERLNIYLSVVFFFFFLSLFPISIPLNDLYGHVRKLKFL